MSLRDAASSFITRLISCIQTNGKVSLSESSRHSVSVVCVCEIEDGERLDYLVMNVIVTAVKRGLRSKQEVC